MVFPGKRFDPATSPLPWLCIAIVGVGLLVLLLLPEPSERGARTREDAQAEAFDYWQSHGHLEIPPSALAYAETRFDARSRPLALAAIRELGRRAMPEDESERTNQQARLDHLVAAAGSDADALNPLSPDHPLRRFGFAPADPRVISLVAHPFLHAGWFHFAIVSIFLLGLGVGVEARWGPRIFGAFVLASVLGSCAFHAWVAPASNSSWFGGQAIVASLLAVHLLRHRLDPVSFEIPYVRIGGFSPPPLALPAAWLVANLALALWLKQSGVRNDFAFSPLVGGLAVGALSVPLLRQFGIEAPYRAGKTEPDLENGDARTRIDEAYVARDMGDVDRAFELFRGEARARPDDLEVSRAFWSMAVSTGQTEAAANNMAAQIQRQIQQGKLEIAAALWRDLVEQLPDHRLPTADVFRLVPALLDGHHVEFALAALRQCVSAPRGELSIGLALKILDTAEQLDPFTALMAARRALALPELHEGKRARILERVRELDPEGPEARAYPDVEPVSTSEPEIAPELEPAPDPVPLSPPDRGGETEPAFELPSDWEIDEPEFEVDPSIMDAPEDPDLTIAPLAAVPPPEIAIEETASADEAPLDLASLPRFDGIQAVAAIPTRLEDDVLYFRLANGRKAKVAYRDVQALGVAALRDIASKPVVVIDLLLNWAELGDAPLRTIRLRSDQFDPARLIDPVGTPAENLQAFLAELQARSDALPLPDADAALGRPFRVFKFMRSYQRRVLKVDC